MKPDEALRLMTKAQPETAIRRQVRDYMRLKGWLVIYMMQGPLSHKGIADLYCLKGGRSVWIEIKTPTGRQSDYQKAFQEDVESHGGEYFVVRRLEDLQQLEGVI